jgi:5-methylcytosine-specific restriction endonuclease McrA
LAILLENISLVRIAAELGADIHHLKFRSQGGGDNIANLMCLCRDCHHEVHFGTKIKTDDLIEKHLRLLGIEKATIADDEQHEVTPDGKIIFKHEK